jgi:hypothetical protein
LTIVEDLDVVEDGRAGLSPRGPLKNVSDLVLQRAEEALDTGVVPAVALPAHAADHVLAGEQLPVVAARVLAAPIGVMHQPSCELALAQRHLKRAGREIGVDAGAHRPADHLARAEVEDHREVEPTFRRRDVRDVPSPALVQPWRVEVSREHVRRDRMRVLAVGGVDEATSLLPSEVVVSHQPRDSFLADVEPLRLEVLVNSWASIANALTGRAEAYFNLAGAPQRLRIDADNGLILATISGTNFLAKIDVSRGVVTNIVLPSEALDLAVGPSGTAFVSFAAPNFLVHVAVVDTITGTIRKVLTQSFHRLLEFDQSRGQLVTSDWGVCSGPLRRYSYSPVGPGLTQSQQLDMAGCNCTELRLSPNGNHLALSCGGGNGSSGYALFDYDPAAFTSMNAAWTVGAYPTSADFNPTSTRLVATDGKNLKLYDVPTHALLSTQKLEAVGCSANAQKVGFSGGGKLIYAYSDCGINPSQGGRVYWVVVP